jgi:LPPG:FO 2-phospho-L-lactate transferase
MITVIAGGVGAARFLRGLMTVVDPHDITAIVNVGDDVVLHGLCISPDLDTVTYTLAGAIDPERGWGLADETWQAMAMVRRYGGIDWFNLGDRDLGTHLFRTHRLRQGATLAQVTAEIVSSWELGLTVLPVSNDSIETRVTLRDADDSSQNDALPAGTEINFQEYFVKRHHGVPISAVRFIGAESSTPAPGVLEAIDSADTIVIAPSNPIVSIGPVLAVPGVRDAIVRRRDQVVAVSPIIAGAALKGPADRMLTELGHEASVVGVARLYRELAATLMLDHADADHAGAVRNTGMHPVLVRSVMSTPARAASLALATIGAAHRPAAPSTPRTGTGTGTGTEAS